MMYYKTPNNNWMHGVIPVHTSEVKLLSEFFTDINHDSLVRCSSCKLKFDPKDLVKLSIKTVCKFCFNGGKDV